MTAPADDERFMALALALGRRGLGNTWPNPAVGAVVVKDGSIAGRGWTQPGGRPHAETEALRRAGSASRGATLYATLEPCSHHGRTPPCADAIIAAGIARVVSAIEDPNPDVAGQGHARLRAAGIAVDIGVKAKDAARDNDGHIRRIRDRRPRVALKLAVSADGKAGLAGRKPVAITGEAANAHVHLMRAMHDAILIGIGTALSDDPLLTCRLPGMEKRSPVRVVLDRDLRLSASSRLATTARETPVWILAAAETPRETESALRDAGVEIIRVAADAKGVDLAPALRLLADKGITRLLVEGGPTVASSFLHADLIDEAILLRGPKTIGPAGIDALDGLPLDALTASARLTLAGQDKLGADTIQFYERV
jgi:diaminohydroxyphosphoribosylaminopyrimidine deaminase / 5-amino-6-(5-phosphoribosylamino)uracil reductase